MDDRKLRLKELKKDSKKVKGKYVTGWKTVAIVFLVLAILLTLACVLILPTVGEIALPDGQVLFELTKHTLMATVSTAVGVDLGGLIAPYAPVLSFYLPIGAVGAWLVFFVILIPWGAGKKKWKKSEQYLDYRTMKNTLKQEKKMK